MQFFHFASDVCKVDMKRRNPLFFMLKILILWIMKTSPHRHILVVCALGQELQIVKSVLKWQIFQWIKFHYHICGVGLEKSMISLTQFLSRSDIMFELVINIGLAGYSKVQSGEWRILRSNMREKGDVVQCLRIIQGDAKKELCVPPQYVIPELDIIPLISRYRVVRERNQLESFLEYDDVVAVDMEWYSIEAVCDAFGCSRLFLKVLYDEVGIDDIKDYTRMIEVMTQSLSPLPVLLQSLFYK